jgi:hypothetical protein
MDWPPSFMASFKRPGAQMSTRKAQLGADSASGAFSSKGIKPGVAAVVTRPRRWTADDGLAGRRRA